MQPASQRVLDQSMSVIAAHMSACDLQLVGRDLEIDGREKTLVSILIDTSLVPSLLALLGPDELLPGTGGVSTPPDPSSPDSLTDGLPSWQVQGKKGMS